MANEGPDDDSFFEEWLTNIHRRSKQLFTELANHNIRVFRLSLRSEGRRCENHYWIHDEKTSEEWRQDIRVALENGEKRDEGGCADADLKNALFNHLRQLGYSEIDDVVADVFEGRISNRHASLEHDPMEKDQPDGFGHGGWDNERNLGKSE